MWLLNKGIKWKNDNKQPKWILLVFIQITWNVKYIYFCVKSLYSHGVKINLNINIFKKVGSNCEVQCWKNTSWWRLLCMNFLMKSLRKQKWAITRETWHRRASRGRSGWQTGTAWQLARLWFYKQCCEKTYFYTPPPPALTCYTSVSICAQSQHIIGEAAASNWQHLQHVSLLILCMDNFPNTHQHPLVKVAIQNTLSSNAYRFK